jgi:hypothetical protein
MGAGAVVSILFLGGLFALMGYFVWKAYQRPRQVPRSLQEEPGDNDPANEDNDPERSE